MHQWKYRHGCWETLQSTCHLFSLASDKWRWEGELHPSPLLTFPCSSSLARVLWELRRDLIQLFCAQFLNTCWHVAQLSSPPVSSHGTSQFHSGPCCIFEPQLGGHFVCLFRQITFDRWNKRGLKSEESSLQGRGVVTDVRAYVFTHYFYLIFLWHAKAKHNVSTQ